MTAKASGDAQPDEARTLARPGDCARRHPARSGRRDRRCNHRDHVRGSAPDDGRRPRELPLARIGLWWAAQTVTTVGYGDDVPTTVKGQLLAVLVMLFGIGFLTVVTAAITSSFIERSRLEHRRSDAGPTAEQLRQIEQRLERIEAALTRSS